MRVLIAPDKFKGTLPAPEAAAAMSRGVHLVAPDAEVVTLPLADGGDGTVAVLVQAVGGHIVQVSARGPHGEEVAAPVGLLADGRAVIEMASVVGPAMLERPDPLGATSAGIGDLLAHIAGQGMASSAIVGIGGSASTDGGVGAARACGWRFLDRAGARISSRADALVDLAQIARPQDRRLDAVTVVGACDVSNPLLGERGAARVYAPQKGASAAEVEVLERALEKLAACIESDLGIDVRTGVGAGAGGGLGAGLRAFFAARLVDGFDLIAAAAGLDEALARADLVITGEGRLDSQSMSGKVPFGVARAANRAGITCAAVAGEVRLAPENVTAAGYAAVTSMVDVCGRERSHSAPADALAETAAALMRTLM